jgi:hypothetical protein
VIISHRFSIVAGAYVILVLDKGRLVQQGSHAELVRAEGIYAEPHGLTSRAYTPPARLRAGRRNSRRTRTCDRTCAGCPAWSAAAVRPDQSPFSQRSARPASVISSIRSRRFNLGGDNMAIAAPNQRRRRRFRGRTVVLGVVAGLLASLMTTVGSGAAHADGIACPSIAKADWKLRPARPPIWEGVVYTLQTVTPTFNVSDARSVGNQLDTPVSATFTSQQSKTYSLSVTVGSSASLWGFLTANVSATIVQSRTTSLGVSATVTVPPHGQVNGLYGVDAYIVTYDAHKYWHIGSSPPKAGDRSCVDKGLVTGQSTNAPTYVEGWRLVYA